MIAYSSVYGNTKKAVEVLAQKLEEKGCPKAWVFDLVRDDMAEAAEEAFRMVNWFCHNHLQCRYLSVHENIHRPSDRKKLSEPYDRSD